MKTLIISDDDYAISVHFSDKEKEICFVKSDGYLKDWQDGIAICNNVLSYGKDFNLDKD